MSKQSSSFSVWIHGATGRMGLEITKILGETDSVKLGGASARSMLSPSIKAGQKASVDLLAEELEKVDVVIDFSTIAGNELLLNALTKSSKAIPCLIGTTGLSEDSLSRWSEYSKSNGASVLIAANTSLGVLLLTQTAVKMAKVLTPLGFDIELLETHHRNKIDAPSGTAKFITETLLEKVSALRPEGTRFEGRQRGEIGVKALRGGQVFGEHELRFMGDFEELSISHKALSRTLFAKGALTLAAWVKNQKAGIYSLLDVDLENLF